MTDSTPRLAYFDFEVEYRFLSAEEGGRTYGPPVPGYRCDWLYEGDDPYRGPIFMIWPTFVDEAGNYRPDGERVPAQGRALMTIVNPAMRPEHQQRIAVGVKGYLVEGPKKVAEAVVVAIHGLHTNPVP